MINIEKQPGYNFIYYFLVILKFIGMLLKNHDSIKWIWIPLLIYWPLCFDKDNICNNYITDHILCIPVDQRYNIKHMEYIANIINQAL